MSARKKMPIVYNNIKLDIIFVLYFQIFIFFFIQALGGNAPIVPTKILGDPEELDRHLLRSGADTVNLRRPDYDNGNVFGPDTALDVHVSLARSLSTYRIFFVRVVRYPRLHAFCCPWVFTVFCFYFNLPR